VVFISSEYIPPITILVFFDVYNKTKKKEKPHLWLYLLRDTFAIYCVCFITELIRSMLFNFFIFNRSYYKRFCNWIDSFFEDDPNKYSNETESLPDEENLIGQTKLETDSGILNHVESNLLNSSN
jgi:hypothetical protein